MKRTKEDWVKIFDDQKASGKSIKDWCAENHITDSQFYHWRKIIYGSSKQEFCELKPFEEHSSKKYIKIRCNGFSLTVNDETDLLLLSKVLQAVRNA